VNNHKKKVNCLLIIITVTTITSLFFPFYSEVFESFFDYSTHYYRKITFNENKLESYSSIPELRNTSSVRSHIKRPSFSLEGNFNLTTLRPIDNGTKSEIPSENPQGITHWQIVSDNNDSSYIIEDYASATSYTDTIHQYDLRKQLNYQTVFLKELYPTDMSKKLSEEEEVHLMKQVVREAQRRKKFSRGEYPRVKRLKKDLDMNIRKKRRFG
jgi:hypothetical protein